MQTMEPQLVGFHKLFSLSIQWHDSQELIRGVAMCGLVSLDIQATDDTYEYASFIGKKVADQDNGVWTIGTAQFLHQDILSSMMRMLPTNTVTSCPTKVSLFRLCGQMTP
jgi:hypothetical protein